MPYLKIVERSNPQKPEEKLYHPILQSARRIELEEIASRVADKTALSLTDIIAANYALFEVIPPLLAEGHIVSLGPLGTISVTLGTAGHLTPEEVSVKDIKEIYIRLRPAKKLKKAVGNMHLKMLP